MEPLRGTTPARRPVQWWPTGAIVLAVLLGVGLRVFILTHALGVLDSDEAVTGLMARRLVEHGELHVFYWRAPYGGTLEAYVTALPFAIFGSSVLTLKLVSVLWQAVAVILLWRIGRRLIDERAGVVAALAMWVWPGNYVWWSTKSRGYYGAALMLGLVIVLCAIRLAEHPASRRDWLVLGLAFGLGWWATPQIMFLAAPAGLWLVLRNWRAVRWAPFAIPTALIGAAPWLYWNVRHQWWSLHGPPNTSGESRLESIGRFWTENVPMALGLRVPFSIRWLVPRLALAIYLLALALGAWSLLTRRRGAAFLAVGIGLYPLLFALNPINTTVEGRYLFLMSPLISLLVGHAARGRAAILGTFVVIVTITIGGLSAIPDGLSPTAPDIPAPIEMGPLISSLEAQGVDAVYSNYWIAYRLTFESRERVIADASDYNRFQPYEAFVRASPRAAWVFVSGSAIEKSLATTLEQKGIRYQLTHAGRFSIYLPERNVPPEEVPCAQDQDGGTCVHGDRGRES